MFWTATRCTSDPRSRHRFGHANRLGLTALRRWVASVQKEKEEAGVPLLDDAVDAPYTAGAQRLRAGLPPLDLATTKDFFRYYDLSSDGTLDPRMTAESLNSQAERFFAGFTRVTSSIVTEQDRSHIYNVSALAGATVASV